MTSRWQRLVSLGTLSALALLGTNVPAPPASAGPAPGVVIIPIADQARIAITGKANSLSAVLGSATSSITALNSSTYRQRFQRGAVYWSPSTGARAVVGDIYARWQELGGWTSYGLPTTDETGTPDGIGRYNHFNSGMSIYWTASTGAQEVYGDIRTKWASLGWERAGYPTTGERGTPDGIGRYNHFTGMSIYWTLDTGAHEVHGAILEKWAATGWERGVGYPTTDETGTPDGIGRYNHFTGGSIYWTSTTGAHPVSGPIRDAWARDGWERGRGYPVTDPGGSNTVCGSVVRSQRFATLSGADGWYCQDANGWVRWVPTPAAPPPTSTTTRPTTTTTMRPAPSTTTTTTLPPATGSWICNVGGTVPPGMVATQIGPIAGCNGTGMFVVKPTTSMWICAWGDKALDGFITDQMNPSAGVCSFGPQYHITKV